MIVSTAFAHPPAHFLAYNQASALLLRQGRRY
jgi:hypothetical protein